MPMSANVIDQAAAVPFRRTEDGEIEVLLVTSRAGDWSTPKGHIDVGNSPQETAEIETVEEAGAIGQASDQILGVYEYTKPGRPGRRYRATVFPVEVDLTLDHWEEMDDRERRWVPLERAVIELAPLRPDLSDCVARLAELLVET